jgi:hypothetical protein
VIDFWLGEAANAEDVVVTILDGGGETVANVPVEAAVERVNRAVWNLRLALGDEEDDEGAGGPPALPGLYTVRLDVAGRTMETPLVVRPDPREDIEDGVRFQWTEELFIIQRLAARANDASARAEELLEARGGEDDTAEELLRQAEELRSRLRRLSGSVGGRVGPLTADERRQRDFLGQALLALEAELDSEGGD